MNGKYLGAAQRRDAGDLALDDVCVDIEQDLGAATGEQPDRGHSQSQGTTSQR